MASATLLLPPAGRFAEEPLPQPVARALGRADVFDGPSRMEDLFDVLPRGWPAAAVTRQFDVRDAGVDQWLRADPAYVRPDINGARLLAIGEGLGLDAGSADALIRPLRPLFGDAGFHLDAPGPSRWYLRLPAQSPLPRFASPADALGADLFEHLPDGPEGRRWRALLSEAQVVLHNHPLNEQRAERGLAPVNSVWFWGGGRLPDRIQARFDVLHTTDTTALAFASGVPARTAPVEGHWGAVACDAAVDLRRVPSMDELSANWLEPALADIAAGRLDELRLAWPDRSAHRLRRSHSLRFWRRPLRSLIPRTSE